MPNELTENNSIIRMLNSFFNPKSVNTAIVGIMAITKNITLIPSQLSTTETSTLYNLNSKKYCMLNIANLIKDKDKNRISNVGLRFSIASIAQENRFRRGNLSIIFINQGNRK